MYFTTCGWTNTTIWSSDSALNVKEYELSFSKMLLIGYHTVNIKLLGYSYELFVKKSTKTSN